MAQWNNTDNYSNSVLWAIAGYKRTANTGPNSNRQFFYDNVTRGATITNQITGQFGVDTTEVGVNKGPVVHITVTYAGSGYTTNTANTPLTAVQGGSGAYGMGVANATGRIASVTVTAAGSNYISNPTLTLPAPSAVVFNGNTGVNGAVINTASAGVFAAGDLVSFSANSISTPGGLANGVSYYINFANATVFTLAATSGGANIDLTDASGNATTAGGASITGQTATAIAVVGGAKNKGVAHAGWNVRKVGTGGRAGRVHYETLVAFGTLTGDGSDDSILPDS